MPGEDELALLAHDARLAAIVLMAAGLALTLSAVPRRAAASAWLGGVLAMVIANAALGPVVDGGSVLLAAGALVLVVAAGGAGAHRVSARRRGDEGAGARGEWSLVGAGVVAAGTLPVLVAQGTGSPRYRPWVPGDLATANWVTALGLAAVVAVAAVLVARTTSDVVLGVVLPAAALVVLLGRSGSSWQVRDAAWVMGVVLVLAYAPFVVAAATPSTEARTAARRRVVAGVVLAALGGLFAAVPQLLALPIVVGGMLGLVVTMPAGAYVNYDGFPVIGGGVLIAVVLFVPLLVLRDGTTRVEVPV
ncbi:hypothetical protein GTR02_01485 [Kineococcus sp. R8]|uniref:hypothetical protein n=1 Tax=Kineococcus siccus TaxID=2696567 RepID=UPI001412E776|nr:hypothetical protein [Kineococcus siccus]NAZ80489.1 hypothetical protein [Kineococcus siccus]